MALRTFQFCIVFTIGGILINSTILTSAATEPPSSSTSSSLDSPPLSIHLARFNDNVKIVTRGQSVYLDCPIIANSTFITYGSNTNTNINTNKYIWLYNDEPIRINNSTQYKQFPNGTLYINKMNGKKKNIQSSSASYDGYYRCKFTNHIGTVITEPIQLKLPTLSRTFIEQPNNITVEEGEFAIFKCRITSVPDAMIQWEYNFKPLKLISRLSSITAVPPKYIILPDGSLVIHSVQSSLDEGMYSCTATNPFQKKVRKSTQAYLKIVVPTQKPKKPHIITGNRTQVIVKYINNDATLYCLANGYPKPLVEWEVPYNNTVNTLYETHRNSTLYIKNITAETAKNYTCIAQNDYGKDSQIWSIQLPPYFTEMPKSRHVPPAQTVRMNCSANGTPVPQITWLKNGQPLWPLVNRRTIDGGKFGRITVKANTIQIADTILSDSGLYQCVATNVHGEVRNVARILVKPLKNNLPPPPTDVSCRPYSPYSICLTWNWKPDQMNVSAAIQAYTIHYMIYEGGPEKSHHPTNKTYVLVDSLEPHTNYSFYVRAYFQTGASEQSDSVVCHGDEISERIIELEAESPEILIVRWKPLFNDTTCGQMTAHYKIQWRRKGQYPSNSAQHVTENIFTNSQFYEYHIIDLIPLQTYEVRVLSASSSNEGVTWHSFTMPNTTSTSNVSKPSSSFISHLEAIPTSPYSINVTWQPTMSTGNFSNTGGYYNVCYTEENSLGDCEETGIFVKSLTNSIEIKDLKPYTTYRFQVRYVHEDSINNHYETGNFSHFVECQTLEGIATPVRGLYSKYKNITARIIEWQTPSQINGKLRNFIVFYIPIMCVPPSSNNCTDQKTPFHKWKSIVVSANKYNAEIPNLKSGVIYNVTVVAENGAGKGKPASIRLTPLISLIPIGTSSSAGPQGENKPSSTENEQDQTVGIVIGCSIAALCILICTSYVLWYRKCIKTNLNNARPQQPYNTVQTRNLNATNGHRNIINSDGSTIFNNRPTQSNNDTGSEYSIPLAGNNTVEMEEEAHEMQCLVRTNITQTFPPHIPPVIPAHLDTKGGSTYPNGHIINGLKFSLNNSRLPNGIVRITENPQYNTDYEYDSHMINSTNNNSGERNCNFEQDHLLLNDAHRTIVTRSIVDDVDDGDDELNSTQLTNLDNSVVRMASSESPSRTISPVLGPNG